MKDPANLLMTDEIIAFDVRHHWLALWKPITAMLVFLALWIAAASLSDLFRSGAAIIIGIALFLLLLCGLTWSALAHSRARLTLTDRRLIYRSGVFSRQLREVPLSRVTDVSVYQSVPSRVFGFGDLVVTTSGEPGFKLPFLDMPHPEQLRVKVLERIHEAERKASTPADVAREIALEINRNRPTAEIGPIPPERPPLYSEIVDQIERLDAMRERGSLTDEEFRRAKEALLDRMESEHRR